MMTNDDVTGPCFPRVRRFRRRIVLVRLFPDSFNNSSLAFTLTSLDPRSNLQAAAPNSTNGYFPHIRVVRSTFYPCQPTRSQQLMKKLITI